MQLPISLDPFIERSHLRVDGRKVIAIVLKTRDECIDQPATHHDRRQIARPAHRPEAEFPAQVRPNQVGFRHNHLLEQVVQEVAAIAGRLGARGTRCLGLCSGIAGYGADGATAQPLEQRGLVGGNRHV
ncbi:hypothetical protein D3C87_1007250 [compost metagenome]